MKKVLLILASLTSVFSLDANAKDNMQEFSRSLTVEYKQQALTLSLTGTSKRKILFVPIYHIAHYASSQVSSSQNDSIYDSILSSSGTKQVSIVFKRDLDASRVQKTLIKGVKENSAGNEFQQVQACLELFKQQINQDVKKNDIFSLRWLEDGRLLSIYHDEVVGEINSPLLARLLWSIWFGDQAVVDRSDLIQNIIRGRT